MKNLIKIHPAVVAVWASVVASGHLLPVFPILGTGGTFSVSHILNPLSGIFFGPLGGALCSAAGGFIGTLIAPHTAWMGLGTFIIGTTTAFTTGCIAWGKGELITINTNGSLLINGGIIVYIAGTILWFTQEIGRSFIWLPVIFYGIGFLVMITGIIFAQKLFQNPKRFWKFPAIWICTFSGLIGGATIGNFFSLIIFKQPKEIWTIIMVSAPIERALFALGAMLVGVPLLIGLNKAGISVGPQKEEE
ncbi:MAG: hypothetical protein FWB86_00915 [Treponema sp.]|nr:hypothetical protein [Treponema sp.]MCL2250659.1 hypothetical protein [Treponema sp.]